MDHRSAFTGIIMSSTCAIAPREKKARNFIDDGAAPGSQRVRAGAVSRTWAHRAQSQRPEMLHCIAGVFLRVGEQARAQA